MQVFMQQNNKFTNMTNPRLRLQRNDLLFKQTAYFFLSLSISNKTD